MAKQRRARARPTKKKPPAPSPTPIIGVSPAPRPLRQPPKRSTFLEAVQAYERGLQTLQKHHYDEAAEAFKNVLGRYPEEKELHERARLYLNVCLRQLQPPDATPRSADERVYAATLAINDGRYDTGAAELEAVLRETPEHDYALYMLGVANALRGVTSEAVLHLRRSFELNPENLARARRDPDLESLRQNDTFRQLLESLSPARRERRSSGRSRSAR